MKRCKIILSFLSIIIVSMIISGCGNTSGSVSYSMGVGYGYPMYYGNGHRHTDVIVVKPPGRSPSRPSRPPSNPRPRRR